MKELELEKKSSRISLTELELYENENKNQIINRTKT